MKSFVLLPFAFFSMITAVVGQEQEENSFITVCDDNRAEFTLDELKRCNRVGIRENDYGVKSFSVVIMKKGKGEEFPIEGDAISEEVFQKIEKQKAPRTIRIAKLMDTNDTEVEGYRELILTD